MKLLNFYEDNLLMFSIWHNSVMKGVDNHGSNSKTAIKGPDSHI